MTPIQIRCPIWNGGKRVVGIAEYKLGAVNTDIEIMYRNRFGERIYPFVYTMTRSEIAKYPVKIVGCGVRLRLIPIADLHIKADLRDKETIDAGQTRRREVLPAVQSAIRQKVEQILRPEPPRQRDLFDTV